MPRAYSIGIATVLHFHCLEYLEVTTIKDGLCHMKAWQNGHYTFLDKLCSTSEPIIVSDFRDAE